MATSPVTRETGEQTARHDSAQRPNASCAAVGFGGTSEDLVAEQRSELVAGERTKLARSVASRDGQSVRIGVVDDGQARLLLFREAVDEFESGSSSGL